jgi:hypothetical protein
MLSIHAAALSSLAESADIAPEYSTSLMRCCTDTFVLSIYLLFFVIIPHPNVAFPNVINTKGECKGIKTDGRLSREMRD